MTAAEVFKTLQQNADASRRVAAAVLEDLVAETELLNAEVGGMQYSIMPRSQGPETADVEKLRFVLPEYFR